MQESLGAGVIKQLRALQITIKIFNDSQSVMIFGLKNCIITAAVVMSFFGIQYFHSNVLVGLFNIICAFYASLIFIALYDHAFAIPVRAEYVRKVAPLARLTRSRERQMQSMTMLKRELLSFPTMGIQVGHFYHMERDSTPRFLDFVAAKTFTMLVTFR